MKSDPIGGIVTSDPYDIKNTETIYYYDNQGRLISEITNVLYYSNATDVKKIEYIYDQNNIIGMDYSFSNVNQRYYFKKNALGDVSEIYDTNGNIVAKYDYNAFGECTIASGTTEYQVARYNPIRYRGYYYDHETQRR